jgi:PPOX class probable F420-dependent enzyme
VTVILDAATRKLLDARSFATVATLGPNGEPHTSVIWVDRDGDTPVFSTLAGRQKARNLARDPRLSMTLFDLTNPYHTVEIRGVADLIEDPDRALSYRVTHKYLGTDPPADPPGHRRLIVRVHPEKIITLSV